jgi:hypothetical protein
MKRTARTVAILILLVVVPGTASAGARPYAYVYGSDVLPQTSLELESWFSDQEAQPGVGSWDWWLGPVVGVTDWLEMGMFAIFGERPVTLSGPTVIGLDSLRFVATFAPADKGVWPVDVRLRLEYGQGVGPHSSTAWLTFVVSRDFGALNLALNIGPWLNFASSGLEVYVDYSAGASFEVFRGVRIGGEFFGDAEVGGDNSMFVGPSLAVGTGRVWLSATVGPGLVSGGPTYHGRVIVGLAL